MITIGVDVGGTKIAAVATVRTGEVCAQIQHPTEAAQLVDGIAAAIWAAVRASKRPIDNVVAIGIGIPGMVDRADGTVALASNLGIEQPLPLVALLSAEFSGPIVIENDARLAALGVSHHLQLPNVAYISIGTGIAAGLVTNGDLQRGRHGMAGEIGHMMIDNDGTLLEQRVAGPAIVAQARAKRLDVQHAGDVYQLAAAGNLAAQQIVADVSQLIARAIQWLIMMVDVERVVIGGGVTRSGQLFFNPILTALAQLRAQSTLNAQMLPEEKLLLLPHHLNAGLCGAAHLAWQHVDS